MVLGQSPPNASPDPRLFVERLGRVTPGSTLRSGTEGHIPRKTRSLENLGLQNALKKLKVDTSFSSQDVNFHPLVVSNHTN